MVFYNDTINSKFAKLQIVFFLRFLFCQTTLNRYTGTLNKQSIHHDFEIIIRLRFALIFIGWVHYSNAPLFLLVSCLALWTEPVVPQCRFSFDRELTSGGPWKEYEYRIGWIIINEFVTSSRFKMCLQCKTKISWLQYISLFLLSLLRRTMCRSVPHIATSFFSISLLIVCIHQLALSQMLQSDWLRCSISISSQ